MNSNEELNYIDDEILSMLMISIIQRHPSVFHELCLAIHVLIYVHQMNEQKQCSNYENQIPVDINEDVFMCFKALLLGVLVWLPCLVDCLFRCWNVGMNCLTE